MSRKQAFRLGGRAERRLRGRSTQWWPVFHFHIGYICRSNPSQSKWSICRYSQHTKTHQRVRVGFLDPKHVKRQLMVSPFNPVQSSACENTCNIPYMSPNAALYVDAFYGPLGIPGGVLGKIKLQVCCTATCQESKDIGDVPLVFLLHIFGGTRLLHSALVQVLASSGFADITVAHTFKSFVVEFPYGSVIPSLNDSSWDLAIPGRLGPLQDIRVDDVRFVFS